MSAGAEEVWGHCYLGVSISGPNLCEMACHKSVQLWGCEAWSLWLSGANQETKATQEVKQGELNIKND